MQNVTILRYLIWRRIEVSLMSFEISKFNTGSCMSYSLYQTVPNFSIFTLHYFFITLYRSSYRNGLIHIVLTTHLHSLIIVLGWQKLAFLHGNFILLLQLYTAKKSIFHALVVHAFLIPFSLVGGVVTFSPVGEGVYAFIILAFAFVHIP